MAKRTSNDACRLWTAQYGVAYKNLLNCTNDLHKALRSPGRSIAAAMGRCSFAIRDADNIAALEFVRSCIRKGRSHGLLQPKKRRSVRAPQE